MYNHSLTNANVYIITSVGGYFGAKKHRENKEKKRMDAENNSGVVNGGATGKDHEGTVIPRGKYCRA